MIGKMRRLLVRIQDAKPRREELKLEVRQARSSGDIPRAFAACQALSDRDRTHSATRYRQVCQLTGRARSVVGFFGLSRCACVRMAKEARLAGVTKSSW